MLAGEAIAGPSPNDRQAACIPPVYGSRGLHQAVVHSNDILEEVKRKLALHLHTVAVNAPHNRLASLSAPVCTDVCWPPQMSWSAHHFELAAHLQAVRTSAWQSDWAWRLWALYDGKTKSKWTSPALWCGTCACQAEGGHRHRMAGPTQRLGPAVGILMITSQHSTLSLRLACCHRSLWHSKQLASQQRTPFRTMAAAVAAPSNVSQLIDDINSKYELARAPQESITCGSRLEE